MPERRPVTRRMTAGEPHYPTSITGHPVEESHRVYWESQKIGVVWWDGDSWSWSLHEITGNRTRGRTVIGGGASSKDEAVAFLTAAEGRYQRGDLEGHRPPETVTIELGGAGDAQNKEA